MPLVRVHEASDGQLFKNYEDYVKHEENLLFEKNWETSFKGVFFETEDEEDELKQFAKAHQDRLLEVIQTSKVKRKSGKK